MSIPFSNTHYRIPQGFANLLEGLAREVLRQQPKDIPLFGAKYFAELLKRKQESNFDPAEWGAALDDRFYNNHAFKEENTDIIKGQNATIIQAAFRGHVAREEVKRLKEAAKENYFKSTPEFLMPDLTPEKHDFLQDIQQNNNHEEESTIAKAVVLTGRENIKDTSKLCEGNTNSEICEEALDATTDGLLNRKVMQEETTTETMTLEIQKVKMDLGKGGDEKQDLKIIKINDTREGAVEEQSSDKREQITAESYKSETLESPPTSEMLNDNFAEMHVDEQDETKGVQEKEAEYIQDNGVLNILMEQADIEDIHENKTFGGNSATESNLESPDKQFDSVQLQSNEAETPEEKNETFRKQQQEALDIPLDDPDANAAAAKIQAGFRGHMTRKKMRSGEKDIKNKECKDASSTCGETEGD